MSEHVCLVCEHGPHRKTSCSACGCQQWVNTVVATGRSSVSINNLLVEEIPKISNVLVTILELLIETNPDAVAVIDARRAKMREELQAQTEPEGDLP